MSGQWFVDKVIHGISLNLMMFQSPMSGQWFVDKKLKKSFY